MPLTQNHQSKADSKYRKPQTSFMHWASARCPHCGLPITDWMPLAVPGPQERMAASAKRK